MQRVGAYQSVAFDDPVIHAVIEDLGGWTKLCRSDLKELSYMEHRFLRGVSRLLRAARSVLPGPSSSASLRQSTDTRAARSRLLCSSGTHKKAADVLRLGGSGVQRRNPRWRPT